MNSEWMDREKLLVVFICQYSVIHKTAKVGQSEQN